MALGGFGERPPTTVEWRKDGGATAPGEGKRPANPYRPWTRLATPIAPVRFPAKAPWPEDHPACRPLGTSGTLFLERQRLAIACFGNSGDSFLQDACNYTTILKLIGASISRGNYLIAVP
ncbi:MAG: hypothetical protein HQM09_13815 [Candidatus Riflebacteria bacterium]|nr:hypothetical protein [Candidatus Riflebacteria bacterium]